MTAPRPRYYRLRGMVLLVLRTPALGERREDIPVLATLFPRRACRETTRLTPTAHDWLAGRAWRGNVRELKALMECAAALAVPQTGGTLVLDAADLAFADGGEPPPDLPEAPAPSRSAVAGRSTLDQEVRALERRIIVQALEETGHNHTHTARLLGLSRVGLPKKMDRMELR